MRCKKSRVILISDDRLVLKSRTLCITASCQVLMSCQGPSLFGFFLYEFFFFMINTIKNFSIIIWMPFLASDYGEDSNPYGFVILELLPWPDALPIPNCGQDSILFLITHWLPTSNTHMHACAMYVQLQYHALISLYFHIGKAIDNTILIAPR